jgi:lipopolysaccharide assembly outer membrane protein LptD (OstA)
MPLRLRFVLSLLPIVLAAAQTPTGLGPVEVVANRLVRDGAVIQATGHVHATIGGLAFEADEATMNSQTSELELRGHVRVTLPARADRSVFRFRNGPPPASTEPGAIVTGDPVGLSAGQMTVKDGLLKASGDVVVRATDAQVRGDELSMVLRTGDATLSGHIVAAGKAAHQEKLPEMPIEIWK